MELDLIGPITGAYICYTDLTRTISLFGCNLKVCKDAMETVSL